MVWYNTARHGMVRLDTTRPAKLIYKLPKKKAKWRAWFLSLASAEAAAAAAVAVAARPSFLSSFLPSNSGVRSSRYISLLEMPKLRPASVCCCWCCCCCFCFCCCKKQIAKEKKREIPVFLFVFFRFVSFRIYFCADHDRLLIVFSSSSCREHWWSCSISH